MSPRILKNPSPILYYDQNRTDSRFRQNFIPDDQKMIRFFQHMIRNKPLFLFLLPLFFVYHGYTENYNLVPAKDAFFLLLQYLGITIILLLLSLFYFRDFKKASLLVFFLLCLQFFFGNFQDLLKTWFAGYFITKYSFILPFFLLVFVLITIFLKRKKQSFLKPIFYLNSLFTILLLIETGQLIIKTFQPGSSSNSEQVSTVRCDTCQSPDIYLIIADGYPGKIELYDLFHYDNTPFLNELEKRNFHVTDSSISNYNFTPFSMASMLNMDYLHGITGSNHNKNDLAICYNTLKTNSTYRFLATRGYEFFNFSIFDFAGQPSLARPTFLVRKTKLITSATFLYRINKEIGFHLATGLKLNFILKYLRNFDLKNNTKLYSLTKTVITNPATHPKFVYTHLVMPHHPYYFDSLGHPVSYHILTDEYAANKEAFVSYLKYANHKYLALIDDILARSAKPPIILFMSDHGFREFKEPVETPYHFMNINAILLPGSNYSSFYNGMSNVNQFRSLLNTQFGQQLPLLKDSTSFLNE